MARVIHILTRENDPLPASIVAAQETAGHETRVIDLTEVDSNGDYSILLEEIFAADSVQVW